MSIVNGEANSRTFFDCVASRINSFETARIFTLLKEGQLNIGHYHSLLCTLFHQSHSTPYTFAKAAANCSWRHEQIKEYLLKHAEEERTHWRWILADLKSTEYQGADPRSTFPHPTCEAYISFNERIADHMPIARLAIAIVLEGIGEKFGEAYGRQLLRALNIGPEQATFFLRHGETDKVHAQELRELITGADLTSDEWNWMVHAADIAGRFYRAMYDHEAFTQ